MDAGSNLPTIIFLCPICVTGGPEAIHQASMAFRVAGFPSEIAYYRLGTQPERIGDRLYFQNIDENACADAFAAYEPKIAQHITLTDNIILILPEVLVGIVDAFKPARVAIWWLSVDNALIACPSMADPETCRLFFERAGIEHWYQSDYAKRFLVSNGARAARRLSDFTDRAFTTPQSESPNPGIRILYNRRKGASLAQRFFSAHPQFEPVALDGLDRDALIAAYRSASTYIDFGTLPGKDRMPREAAACGCTIFLHQMGAGSEIGDFPVHDIFRFATDEVDTGQLAAKLQFALSNPLAFWDLQTVLRETIRQERAEFLHEAAVIAAAYRVKADASRLREIAA